MVHVSGEHQLEGIYGDSPPVSLLLRFGVDFCFCRGRVCVSCDPTGWTEKLDEPIHDEAHARKYLSVSVHYRESR